ncbi:MAG: hypothetical protein JSV10_09390 [Candidatus Zixiibacteriota bacterium]|nr:MAG: hypothetical protein JSV10_09390 [candidate division Zixibacteria bacterium]
MKKVLFFVGLYIFILGSASFAAEVPKTINYQGMLTDGAGTPLTGSHNLAFRIWNHPTSGSVKWYENHFGVSIENGLFSVVLGKDSAIILDFAEDYWMSISVGAETMPERIELSSVIYALRAETAKLADSATVAVSAAAGGGWTDDGSVVRLSSSSDKVGIGLSNPNRKLYVAENASGLSLPLKIDNPHSTLNTDATGILFSVGGQGSHQLDANRGKGALVYEYTGTWNRGDFHFLQDSNADSANHPNLSDAVMTIKNDGTVGIGTSDPNNLLELKGNDASLALNTTSALSQFRFAQNGTNKWTMAYNSGSGYLYLYDHSAKAGTRIVFEDGTGDVGVGVTDPSARLHAVGGAYGVKGKGSTAGGYFEDAGGRGFAYIGYNSRWRGVHAKGDSIGGVFGCDGKSGYAYVGHQERGISAYGDAGGGYFEDIDGGNYCYSGHDGYKTHGNGTNSFVQNHPQDMGRVIVYSAPEGDEVATYTRGTARLVGGEARVSLGETFKWVTNPDVGLTAHITPRGDCNGIFVASLTTSEMVVKELGDGTSDAAFDYLVYGLRIGFEEISIVQEKNDESYIPSMAAHRERYNMHPDMRQYNALERFKRMNAEIGMPVPEMSASKSLRDAIHEFDPAIDRVPGPEEM